ncbi:hypothetical protein ACFL2A_04270, partial [Thermodesulfobacteriota bacterium]
LVYFVHLGLLMSIPSGRPMSFAEAFDKSFVISKKTDLENVLVAQNGTEWTRVEIPDELQKADWVHMFGNTNTLYILSDTIKGSLTRSYSVTTRIFRYENGKWMKVELIDNSDNIPFALIALEGTTLLTGERIYLGWDRGEFGGMLYSLDAKKGTWERVKLPENKVRDEYKTESTAMSAEQIHNPVYSIMESKDGTLWTSYGQSHLGMYRGLLSTFDGKKWELFSMNSIWEEIPGLGSLEVKKNWPFEFTSFPSLAFDKNGGLFLLANIQGIIKVEEIDINNPRWTKYTKITKDWGNYPFGKELYIVNDDTFLVGFYDAGIGVFNKAGDVTGRITFEK